MTESTQEQIKKHFSQKGGEVFWPSDLSRILTQNRSLWGVSGLRFNDFLDFLTKNSLVKIAAFTSPKYDAITRYVHGGPSNYRLALSLRHHSFLSHATALALHRFEPASNTIFVNQEQATKSNDSELTQAGIRAAFKNQQRKSQYVFHYNKNSYVLLSGKNTERAGVVQLLTPEGETVDSTDLERTLIDIVVRPAYSGGIKRVAAIYNAANNRINIDYLIELLNGIEYLYPYQQSIGFLLQRAGQPEKSLKKLEALRSSFDFFLDYGIKHPVYDERWQLYYPEELA